MTRKILWCLAIQMFSLSALASYSYPQVLQRCTEDNLPAITAKLRNLWARRCFPKLKTLIDFHDNESPRSYLLAKNEQTGSWQAPTRWHHSCDGWQPIAFCVASCYPADQNIQFTTGPVPIGDALELRLDQIVTLSKDATIDHLIFRDLPVKEYSRSRVDGNEVLRYFEMRSKGKIVVTQNHPMLSADGVMVKAREMKVGEYLLRYDGLKDEIMQITDRPFFGKVYNVAPLSGNALENIVIAENYLMGSGAYQYLEHFESLMGRKMMRATLELPQ